MSTEKKSTEKGGRNNGGRGRNPMKQSNSVIAPKFEGMCTKDLKGKVMMFSENKAFMSAQFIKFEAAIYNAAGKASPALSREIDIKRPLVLKDFITDMVHDPMDYTTYDYEGNEVIDKKIKKIYDKADADASKDSVENYHTYKEAVKVFFFRVKGQIDEELTTRIETSDAWPVIKKNRDTSGLMKLLQTVCIHGSDRDYYPERLIKSINNVFNTKQGKQTPNEFKNAMTSNMKVLCDVAGTDIFGLFPNLQKFLISKCDDIPYHHTNLENQSEEDKADLYSRCTECIIGCNMTMRSNKERSNRGK